MKKAKLADIQPRPMLATLVGKPFDDPAWIFEIKWDGYRAVSLIEKGSVSLLSRNGNDLSSRYPEVRKALSKIKKSAIIDGELVAFDESGAPRFQLMQNRSRKKSLLVFCAFDILFYDGMDLRKKTILERKKILKKILPKSRHIRYSDHIAAHGRRFFREAEKRHLEGIMAKRTDSPYLSGKRSENWLKIKTSGRQEAVVIGYTEPRQSRKYIGSLILAVREGKGWRYAGHTGGSMGGKTLKEVYELVKPLVVKKQQVVVPPEVKKSATWIKPRIVVEVKFSEWTESGTMRQPVVVGFRDDKPPGTVREEKALSAPRSGGPERFSHLEKVYWPQEGYTKGDVIDYYDRMADIILPYLKNRPFVLNRHPGGIAKPGFFQKDSSDLNLPEFVETTVVHSESTDKNIRYVVVNNKETLLYVANLGCIEMNPWNSQVGSLDNPDFYVIDLDPGDNTFDEVIEVARVVHDVLKLSCEESYIKTSGKTGLHIYVPLKKKYGYDRVRPFAEMVVRLVNERIPEITSLERSPQKRRSKIYLDWLQNRSGQTLAAPYSLRPSSGATVSTPLQWREIKKGLSPLLFTIETMAARLKKKGDLWKPVLGAGVDLRKAISCIEAELATANRKRRA